MQPNQFLLSSLTRAFKLKNDVISTKLPIYRDLLAVLLMEMENQPYLSILFRTIFLMAYYGLFHASELSDTPSKHTVKACDVQIGFNKEKFMFILRSSKTHGKGAKPQLVKISKSQGGSSRQNTTNTSHRANLIQLPCPYEMLRLYSICRKPYKSANENFFIYNDGRPITAMDLRKCLAITLKSVGFDSTLYGLHSMRSGRVGDLMKLGVPLDTIKKLGCWKSNAVFQYLKHL